jgi:hypothetical protein
LLTCAAVDDGPCGKYGRPNLKALTIDELEALRQSSKVKRVEAAVDRASSGRLRPKRPKGIQGD